MRCAPIGPAGRGRTRLPALVIRRRVSTSPARATAAGRRDPRLLDAWTAAVTGSAAWLRERAGCERLTAFGMGLGGMLAWRAASLGAVIDDLVLWGVPSSGRRILREMRAQSAMIAGRHPTTRGNCRTVTSR